MRGTAGATIDEARGVRNVRIEMIAQLVHFFLTVQLIGLRGSDESVQSTTFEADAEITRSMGPFVSASSVVSITGTPFSTSASGCASCDDGGAVVAVRRDDDVLRLVFWTFSPAEVGFSGSPDIVADARLHPCE